MKKTKLSTYLADTGLSLNRSTQIKQGFMAQRNDAISLAGKQMYEPSVDELKMEQDLQTETNKMLSENQAWVDSLGEQPPPNKKGRFNEWADALIPALASLVRPGKIDDNTDYIQLANTPSPNGNGSQALMKKGGSLKATEGLPIPPNNGGVQPIKQQTDRRLYGYDLLNMAIAEGKNPRDIVLNPEKGTSSKITYLDQINNALGEEQGRLAYTAASIFAQQEGIDKMSKEERIKAFYGGISANPKLNELKEKVGAYNGTRSALSLFETSPLMLPSDYAQNTQKKKF